MSKFKILGRLVSKADEAMEALARQKGTGAEFLRELEKTPGVKQAEIKERGLDKALPALGKTTKAEVKKVMEQRATPKIEETVLGGREEWRRELDLLENRGARNLSPAERERYNELMERRIAEGLPKDDSPAKFQDYILPGGENYREILLRLPKGDVMAAKQRFTDFQRSMREKYDVALAWKAKATPEEIAEGNRLFADVQEAERVYQSSHWNEPNVLAHARVTDRTGPNGEKILHVEEIQSDWHQQGRKQGYKTGKEAKQLTELSNQYDALSYRRRDLLNDAERVPGHGAEFIQMINEANSITPQLMRLQEQMDALRSAQRSGVPDAPFKKNWHELTMKRLLDYAADKNYDKIAITPGAEQAKRYDLSKQIGKLEYDFGPADTVGHLKAYGLDGGRVIDRTVKPEELADYIGKEAAEKLIKTPAVNNTHMLEGVDLQVGGEGMKGFYDQILPTYLNSLGKPYGAKVGTMNVSVPSNINSMPEAVRGPNWKPEFNGVPVHTFDITPQMREEIKAKGLPLYQQIGVPIGAGAAGAEAVKEEPKTPVHISDNPDTMRMELGMKDGGAAFGAYTTGKKYQAAKKRAEEADVNLLKDPKTYAAVMGLLGEAPDELGFSVLHPEYESIKKVAEPAFVVGTALGLAPAAKPALQAGKALAKAAAPKAGQALEQYMMERGMALPLTVYHGSPHKFEKFDPSKIGTGEGAQAYGHGLYFAESPDVASTYASMRSPMPRLYKNGEPFEAKTHAEMLAESRALGAKSLDEAIERQTRKLQANKKNEKGMALLEETGRSIEEERRILDALRNIKSQGYQPGFGGSLYTVDLPDEKTARMLDWDKPLSEQPKALKPLLAEIENVGSFAAEKIRALANQPNVADWAKRDLLKDAQQVENSKSPAHVAGVLKRMQLEYGISSDSGPFQTVAPDFLSFVKGMQAVPNMDTGGGAVSYLQARYGEKGASEMLREAGIPGIKYLDQSSRAAGEGTHNFVVFPGEEEALTILERKKKGGSVRISDNPDTMRMELAGGGTISKLAKLLRAPAKTKQEIEAIAERMAPQVTGEYVREKPGSAVTIAGKTAKQFEREKNLPVDIRATSVERTPGKVDIEKLKDQVAIGIAGDPTVTGKTLYGVGETRLASPAPQHGGPLYGLYHDQDHFWASGLGAARRVQNLAKEASQQYDAPVLGKYVMMGPESINYAQHFADANLQAIDLSKMTAKQVEGFNNLLRKGSPASGPRPSFPGIEDKESAYLQMAFDPELRKHFNQLMQQPTVTEKFGLPSGQDIRFAITEPELRNLERGVTGYSMGRMKPEVEAKALKMSEHPTYSHDIPGEFMGQTKYPIPYELSFPDTLKAIRENPKQAPHEFGSLKMVGPRQIIDQQLIDEIKAYEDRMKALTGKKKGGAIKKAPGGEVTVPDMTDGGKVIDGGPFKKGGKVQFTDNLDTMRLAVGRK